MTEQPATTKKRMTRKEAGDRMTFIIKTRAEQDGIGFYEAYQRIKAEKPDLIDAYHWVIKHAEG